MAKNNNLINFKLKPKEKKVDKRRKTNKYRVYAPVDSLVSRYTDNEDLTREELKEWFMNVYKYKYNQPRLRFEQIMKMMCKPRECINPTYEYRNAELLKISRDRLFQHGMEYRHYLIERRKRVGRLNATRKLKEKEGEE